MIDTTPSTATRQNITMCSTASEASGEDTAGSAWSLRRIMLIELSLPWAYNSLRSRHAPEGLEKLVHDVYDNLAEPWGMIGIAPDAAYSPEGMSRIIDLRQGDGIASAYWRDSYLVPSDSVVDYLRWLSFAPDHPALRAARQPDDQSTREFFICTHGAIDACCATIGYPIYRLLRTMADQTHTPTRVWRCTHFGGHRFAATALEAPHGRYWGHLKADMLSALMHRSAPARDLRRHYRGWAALPDALWQIAEAELFATVGWAWTNATITDVSGVVTAEQGGLLNVSFTHPNVKLGTVEIDINPIGSIQTMDTSSSGEYRAAPQYRATILSRQPLTCLTHCGRETAVNAP